MNDKLPSIRFKEFTDDWEQRKLSELCDMVTVGIANSATHAYSDSGIVMFRNQNIKPNFLDDNDIIHIKPEFESRYKNKRLKKNDLLVARTGYPGTTCVVPEKYENSQTFTTLIARPKNSVNPYFLCQYLNSDIGVKYFESTQIGGGQKNSGAGILNEMPVMLPSGIEEESKIAEYFTNFDNLITLHQRKYDHLLNIKKSMLEKMFPKNGKKAPEIRFDGFTDDWEQRKFGDVVQITMGQSPDGSTYSDEPSDYILVQGNADLQNGWVCPRVWTTQITKKADAGDLIMSVRAPAGAMGKTAYNAVIGRGVAAIKGNEFIYQLLIKMDKEGYWKKDSTGSTFESLNSSSIKNAEIKLPTLEEQNKIGEYFLNLDNLITLHQRKLEKLQNLKISMLKQMFL